MWELHFWQTDLNFIAEGLLHLSDCCSVLINAALSGSLFPWWFKESLMVGCDVW